MKKLLVWALCLLVAGVVLVQCTSQVDESVIYLGYAGPLSGQGAVDGRAARQAIQLYIEEVNRAGGIGGREVVLQIFDDADDPVQARQVAQEIAAADRVLAVIGHIPVPVRSPLVKCTAPRASPP